MEWSNFLIAVTVIYVSYYGFNFLFDLIKNDKNTNKEQVIPLTFEDDTPPKFVDTLTSSPNSLTVVSPKDIDSHQILEEMVEDDVLPITERKEEYFLETDRPIDFDTEDTVTPTGKVSVIDKLISGGLSYKELIKKATEGAILKSAKIDFGD